MLFIVVYDILLFYMLLYSFCIPGKQEGKYYSCSNYYYNFFKFNKLKCQMQL